MKTITLGTDGYRYRLGPEYGSASSERLVFLRQRSDAVVARFDVPVAAPFGLPTRPYSFVNVSGVATRNGNGITVGQLSLTPLVAKS